jgi:O-acetyl-ADP-ribose deacetylase
MVMNTLEGGSPVEERTPLVEEHDTPEGPVGENPVEEHDTPVKKHSPPVKKHDTPEKYSPPVKKHDTPEKHSPPVKKHDTPEGRPHDTPLEESSSMDWLAGWITRIGLHSKPKIVSSKSIDQQVPGVSVYRGDITLLEVDAVVNAANVVLLGGGGVDGSIHAAAGKGLYAECCNLPIVDVGRGARCKTGHVVPTDGHSMPCKRIYHAVGPVVHRNLTAKNIRELESCYLEALRLADGEKLTSIAFPCISTGVYGFPQHAACVVALLAVFSWLERHPETTIRHVIFCTYLSDDQNLYMGCYKCAHEKIYGKPLLCPREDPQETTPTSPPPSPHSVFRT